MALQLMDVGHDSKFVWHVQEHHVGGLNNSGHSQRLSDVECFLTVPTDVVWAKFFEFSDKFRIDSVDHMTEKML